MKHLLLLFSLFLVYQHVSAQKTLLNPAKFEIQRRQEKLWANYNSTKTAGTTREQNESVFGTPPNVDAIDMVGGNGESIGELILHDGSGNIYVIGSYHKELSLGDTTLSGNSDKTYFLAKFNSSGNYLTVSNLIDSDIDVKIEHAEPFIDGFVISGTAEPGTIAVGTGEVITTTSNKAFLIYLNFDESVVWSRTFYTPQITPHGTTELAVKNDSIFASISPTRINLLDQNATDLRTYDLDGDGEITTMALHGDSLLIGGQFLNDLTIDTFSLHDSTYYDNGFIASLNITDGSANWAHNLSSTESQSYILNIATATDGSIFAGGHRRGHFLLQGDPSMYAGYFLMKFNADGTYSSTYDIPETSLYFDDSFFILLTTADSTYFGISDETFLMHTDLNITSVLYDTLAFDDWTGGIYGALYDNNNIYLTGTMDGHLFLNTYKTDGLIKTNEVASSEKSGILSILSLDTDGSNDTYMVGSISGKMEFYGQLIETGRGFIVAKRDRENNLIWYKIIDNAFTNNGVGTDLAVDPNDGSAIVIGQINDHLLIDETPYENIKNSFVSKFSTTGSTEWVIEMPTPEGVAVDAEDNIYISGIFDEQFTIDGNTFQVEPNTKTAYISKFNSAGQFQWLKEVKGAGSAFGSYVSARGHSISYTCELNVGLNSYVTFEGSTYNIGDVDQNAGDNLLVNMNSDGTVNWATIFGADADTSNGLQEFWYCWANSINNDNAGNTYITGTMGRANIFGDTALYSPNKYDHFAAKFDSTGDVSWASVIQTSGFDLNYNDSGIDQYGNFYVFGPVADSVSFNSEVEFAAPESFDAVYTAKYTTDGALEWAHVFDTGIANTGGMVVHGEDALEISAFTDYVSTDQEYNLYSGRGFIMKYCSMPTAIAPTGEGTVFNTDTTSYTVNSPEAAWYLEPAEAGVIIGTGNSIKVAWDNNYTGQASLYTTTENYCGVSDPSDSLQINVEAVATGLEEPSSTHLKAFPNPITDELNITFNNEGGKNVCIYLYDLYGKQQFVLEEGISSPVVKRTYPIDYLAKGAYILIVKDGESSVSQLLVKQ